ncbi:NAD(P)H-dependent oxidoreductase [Clostridium tyrobutyricum]|uniref:flavodoxin n=1 Tax=Clostridium tyrobutyricum TaxID=1519 RepID=UPI001C387C67|nr:flavodoxin [Clostridium tyrobutyricum]MBV4417964.1 NAD(P)H-dependent oxidoreductase [Clostridium tyrobutyricum]
MQKNVKILIAYFSHSGNTGIVAKEIQKQIGGEIFKIQTVEAYPQNYNTVVDIAKQEQKANMRPKLKTMVADMDTYNTIILGYPNWWGTIPMAVFTFLEQYDFTGKIILPYCTHGGSRMGRSEQDIIKTCLGADVLDGLDIYGSDVKNSKTAISVWLKRAGII